MSDSPRVTTCPAAAGYLGTVAGVALLMNVALYVSRTPLYRQRNNAFERYPSSANCTVMSRQPLAARLRRDLGLVGGDLRERLAALGVGDHPGAAAPDAGRHEADFGDLGRGGRGDHGGCDERGGGKASDSGVALHTGH